MHDITITPQDCPLLNYCMHAVLCFPFLFTDHLYARINQLNEDADQLTQLEKSTLNEALILLSNEFKHLDKQSALIQEIMQPFTVMWKADTLKK